MSKGSHWKKPVTKIYDSNYRQGENMYKDQIDRLDNKEKPRSRFGVSFGDLSGSGIEQPSSARRLSDDFMTSFRNRDAGAGGSERPRFNFGDRILDAVGVSEGSNRPGPVTAAINSMDEDPFFQSSLRNRQAPRSADNEFFGSDDPFKRRSNAMSSARERADEMMNEMKKDSAEMMSSMRSRRSEMSSRNESESQGQSKLDMIGQRAKARLANLANYDDELSSPLMSSRLNSDMESSGGQSRSVRISKRSIKSTYETC